MGVQPPNFSWVLPGRLAGLALPRLPAHYQFLSDLGVRHLVSLTERGPPHSDSCPGLTLHRLRIPDFCPPAPDQIDRFVQIVDEANARGEVHSSHMWLAVSVLDSADRDPPLEPATLEASCHPGAKTALPDFDVTS
ncbi:dual specificity protein phosphatase 23 isoform X2 [Cynocephalus volans]|uniref:dual specificity protein phosphatase 23 isoform X2 n=1 Tax=Cynocephalus volans TaxID=110931 RepID=UPI002FCBA152